MKKFAIGALAWLASTALAYGQSISQLPAATGANLTDLVAASQVNQSSPGGTGFTTRKLTLAQLSALVTVQPVSWSVIVNTPTTLAGYGIASPLPVLQGGTGNPSFTANLPLIGNLTGSLIQGARSGNTTTFATSTGVLTNGHCVSIDANGNIIDAGGACTTGGGGGTVNAGTINQLAWYASTSAAVSGLATANNGILVTSAGGVPSISSTLPAAVQGNITSLGTIGSGVWNGSVLGSSFGGAGAITGALRANGSGVVSQAACADLSNSSPSCSTDATNASNISSGSLALARGGLGGTQAAATTNQIPVFPGSSGAAAPTSATTWIDNAIGSTRGSILERGAGGWGIVAPGTSGLPWVSNGAGADPAYQVLGNSGLANMAANTVKCNPTGSSAVPQDCISPVVTSLTASTSLISPLHIGGSTASSSLTLESTSGAGTSDFTNVLCGSQVECFRLDTAGRHLIGLTAGLTNGDATFLTVEDAGRSATTGGAHGLFQFSNDTSSSFLGFFKNRGTVKGTGQTAVQNGDDVGELAYEASDGTNYIKSGYFTCTVDAAVSAGKAPMGCEWGTMNAAGTLFERMRLTSDGNLNVIGSVACNTPRFISTATYTTNSTDCTISFSAAVTVTLTSPVTNVFTPGRFLFVKNTANVAVISASANVAPLAGGANGTAILPATAGKWATLQWDGTEWVIMAAN